MFSPVLIIYRPTIGLLVIACRRLFSVANTLLKELNWMTYEILTLLVFLQNAMFWLFKLFFILWSNNNFLLSFWYLIWKIIQINASRNCYIRCKLLQTKKICIPEYSFFDFKRDILFPISSVYLMSWNILRCILIVLWLLFYCDKRRIWPFPGVSCSCFKKHSLLNGFGRITHLKTSWCWLYPYEHSQFPYLISLIEQVNSVFS